MILFIYAIIRVGSTRKKMIINFLLERKWLLILISFSEAIMIYDNRQKSKCILVITNGFYELGWRVQFYEQF